MSESIHTKENQQDDSINNNEQNQPEYVDKAVYKKTAEDMLKYKSEMRSYKAQLDQIKADNEAKEKQALYEQENWKKLFQQNEEKLKQLQLERDSERDKFINAHKVNSVVQELGGFKKPEYVKFVDHAKIELDENGSLITASVQAEVQRIKQMYPELVKTNSELVKPLPSQAARGASPKSIEQMTPSELAQARRELLNKK